MRKFGPYLRASDIVASFSNRRGVWFAIDTGCVSAAVLDPVVHLRATIPEALLQTLVAQQQCVADQEGMTMAVERSAPL